MPIKIILSDLKNISSEEMADLSAYVSTIRDRSKVDVELEPIQPVTEPTLSLKNSKKKKVIVPTPLIVEAPEVVERVSLPPATQEVIHRTYDDLIAYVLENTRTKKLTFDKVMALVKQFDVPNINSLQEQPEKITPFYTALESLING